MIKELAKKILDLFRQGRGLTQEQIENPSIELSKIMSMVLSECKCSLIDEQGNYKRYGSSIDISIVENIIYKLLSNKNNIPSEIVSKAFSKEGILGPKTQLQFTKKYNTRTGVTELQVLPIMPDNFDDYLGKNNSEIQTKLMDEVLKPYVKDLIFSNETLMKKSPIGAFISKSFFRKKSTEVLKRTYIKILKKNTKNISKVQLINSVNYLVENILQNDFFKKEMINSSINSTELQIIGKVYTGFNGLVYNMITRTINMLALQESPNKGIIQIQDIYYTIIGVLNTLATDISKLNEIQIETVLKTVNRDFDIIPNSSYPIESEYRINYITSDLYRNTLNFVEPRHIDKAMKNLCMEITKIIENKEKMDEKEYIKEVMRINYRFIRIQPFKNANGRTSRALINMLLQTKGMSAYFEKNIRSEYIKSIIQAHQIINQNEQEYINYLINNQSECCKYEEQYLQEKVPILIVKD